jgi:hypothetical protein
VVCDADHQWLLETWKDVIWASSLARRIVGSAIGDKGSAICPATLPDYRALSIFTDHRASAGSNSHSADGENSVVALGINRGLCAKSRTSHDSAVMPASPFRQRTMVLAELPDRIYLLYCGTDLLCGRLDGMWRSHNRDHSRFQLRGVKFAWCVVSRSALKAVNVQARLELY